MSFPYSSRSFNSERDIRRRFAIVTCSAKDIIYNGEKPALLEQITYQVSPNLSGEINFPTCTSTVAQINRT